MGVFFGISTTYEQEKTQPTVMLHIKKNMKEKLELQLGRQVVLSSALMRVEGRVVDS